MYVIEKWKSVSGFPGYEVSTMGRVRSHKGFNGNMVDIAHVLKPRTNPNGYHIVVLYDIHGRPHQLSVHRLVAQTFIPNYDESMVVDHLDGNKTNNRISNLEWVSCAENSIRAYNAGLYEPVFRKTRRPVIVTDIYTGEELYFSGVNEAARYIGYSPAIISRVANMLSDTVGRYTVEFAGVEDRLLYNSNYYF